MSSPRASSPADLLFLRDAAAVNDLVIGFAGSSDQLRVEGQFSGTGAVETFSFSDGTSLTAAQVHDLSMTGGAGDDTIVGSDAADTLRGGLGNDTLQGGLGADTYVFNRGDGVETIKDQGAAGEVRTAC